jgi:hypothetical protein
VSNVLGATPGATTLDEPDNQFYYPFAYRAKLKLGMRLYPCLAPGDEAVELETLWRTALNSPASGIPAVTRARRSASMHLLAWVGDAPIQATLTGRRRPDLRLRLADALAVPEAPAARAAHVVVKSVYASLLLEWLVAREPVTVLVVLREPLNILSSWIELGYVGEPGNDMLDTLDPRVAEQLAVASGADIASARLGSPLARSAWLLGLLVSALKDAVERNPGWHVVAHEDLARSPHEGFRALVSATGLVWDPSVGRRLDEMNRPGRGYELNRVRESLPEAWRSRLSPVQVDEIRQVLSAFPIDDWTHRGSHSARAGA